MAQQSSFQPKNIIVIGGEGFLGHNLVLALLRSYPDSTISSLDLVQRHFNSTDYFPIKHQQPLQPLRHQFIETNLTDLNSILNAFDRIRPELVFHTASPWIGSSPEICQNVNVQGTINTIAACKRTGVKRLVYTSSAGVVFNGNDLINVDERLPIPKIACDHYNITKAKAEAIVLEANDKDSLLTCAIRPAGIFGPGDRQAIPGMIQVLKNKQNGIQIGNNNNLFDWTYVENVVHAHILASQKLDQVVNLSEFLTRLPMISPTITQRSLLTSAYKTDEDNSSLSANDDVELVDLSSSSKDSESEKALNPTSWVHGHEDLIDQPAPARRHRWDQWAPISTQINYPDDTVSVAGEVFFITGGEPVFFWDFARAVWHEYAKNSPVAKRLGLNPKPSLTIVIPAFFAMILASLAKLWSQISKKPVLFTPEKVRYTCASKYHNIEKARVVLGYKPVVGIQEGIQKAVEWYVSNELENENSSDKKND